MATKNEVVEQGKKNAELVVNNAFIDGLSMQLQEKTKYGLSFPDDYNPTNALMGAYLPIFIDNAESVNDFNLPDMDCQLIKLKVSDDKDLRIEVE